MGIHPSGGTEMEDVVILERCGHWPFLTDLEAAAATVAPFSQKTTGGQGVWELRTTWSPPAESTLPGPR